MNETIQRTVQLLIDAGAAKAGAEQFRQAAETIERSAREAAAAGQPITDNAARIERQFNSLKMSIDPLHAAQVRLAQGLQVLEARFKQGNYPVEEMQADIALLTQRYDRAAQSAQRFGSVASVGAGTYRQFGSAIQQAGYQVGDFAVQVASGQGFLRPFIQQGTQLISMFGPWGAVIGAAGAVVGALATSLFGLGDASEDAAAAQESHNKSMSEASRLMDELYGKSERNRQSLEAEVRNRVGVAESELAAAERALALADDRLRAVPGAGGNRFDVNIAARNSAQNEVEAAREIVRLRTQELNLLKAQLGYFSDGRSRMGQDNSSIYYDAAEAAKKLGEETAQANKEAEKLFNSLGGGFDKMFAAGAKKHDANSRVFFDGLGAGLTKSLNDGAARWQRDMAEAARIMESVRTPAEAYLDTIQRLNDLHAKGAIDWETYYRAVSKAQDQLEQTDKTAQYLAETGEQAFDRIGAAATEMAMNGKDAFKDFGNTANAVLSELYQAMFELALVNPLKNLALGEDNPTLSSVGGSIFDWLFGGVTAGSGSNNWGFGAGMTEPRVFHAGGIVGGPAPTRSVPALAFAGAPRFHSGGLPGLRPDEVPAILQRGEIVLPKDWSGRGGGEPTVIIQNFDQRSSGAPIENRRSRGPGGEIVITNIVKDEVNKLVQRGAFDDSLSGRYGVIEQPRDRRG